MPLKLSWHTEKRRASALIPNDKNPRIMSEKQIEDLKKSLRKFNLVEIPVIDSGNKVLVGHQRLMVLKLLGRENEIIEVRVPNRKLSKQEYDRYLLTSNRVHGDWDWEKLAANFEINILLDTGFDEMDLTNIFDDALETEDDNFNVEKELAKIKNPITKTRDMFRLGQHYLICGDSTDPGVVTRLMNKQRVNMIYADPPFNIGLDYNKGIGTAGKYGGTTNDKKSDLEYKQFLKQTLTNGLLVSKKDCHCFFYCDERYIGLLQSIYGELGLVNRRVCLWLKNNQSPTPQVAFNKVYEPCVYSTRGAPYLSPRVLNLNEVLNKEIGSGNKLIDDVLDALNIWLAKKLPGANYEHPTEKPPTLHEKALRRCTKPGDAVLDLFGGSGSTLIACEQLKRRAFLVEKEQIFCDLIIRRYEQLTKSKAKKIN